MVRAAPGHASAIRCYCATVSLDRIAASHLPEAPACGVRINNVRPNAAQFALGFVPKDARGANASKLVLIERRRHFGSFGIARGKIPLSKMLGRYPALSLISWSPFRQTEPRANEIAASAPIVIGV